jgi:flagellar basal-body rod modification protein FlgD
MSTVNPLSLPSAPQSAAAKTSNNKDAFGKDAFMKLLVEQMRHQSPTDPADGQAWINQMTQFSMLEQMQQQSAGQVKANAAAYLGSTVSWLDAKGGSGQGVVEKVDFTGDEPTLTVAGHPGVKISEVSDVG